MRRHLATGIIDKVVPFAGTAGRAVATTGKFVWRDLAGLGPQRAGDRPVHNVEPVAVALAASAVAAGIPLIVAVEDVHYAGETMAQFLRTLLSTPAPVTVLATTWPHRIDHGPASTLLGTGAELHRIRPDGDHLTADDAARLLHHLIDGADPETVGRIADIVRLPQALHEIAAQPGWRRRILVGNVTDRQYDSLPTKMTDLYRQMWEALDGPHRVYLQLAAAATTNVIEDAAAHLKNLMFSPDVLDAIAANLDRQLRHVAGRMGDIDNYLAWAAINEPGLYEFIDRYRYDVVADTIDDIIDVAELHQMLLNEASGWFDSTPPGQDDLRAWPRACLLIAHRITGTIEPGSALDRAAIAAATWHAVWHTTRIATPAALDETITTLERIGADTLDPALAATLVYRTAAALIDRNRPEEAEKLLAATVQRLDPDVDGYASLVRLRIEAAQESGADVAEMVDRVLVDHLDLYDQQPNDDNALDLAYTVGAWVDSRPDGDRAGRRLDRVRRTMDGIDRTHADLGAAGAIEACLLNYERHNTNRPLPAATIARLRAAIRAHHRGIQLQTVRVIYAWQLLARHHETTGNLFAAAVTWTAFFDTYREGGAVPFPDVQPQLVAQHAEDLLIQAAGGCPGARRS